MNDVFLYKITQKKKNNIFVKQSTVATVLTAEVVVNFENFFEVVLVVN